jgi:hypothetical protein
VGDGVPAGGLVAGDEQGVVGERAIMRKRKGGGNYGILRPLLTSPAAGEGSPSGGIFDRPRSPNPAS